MRGNVVMHANTIKAVEDTVLSLFIDTKKPQTVMEIRAECKLSETIIRKVLDDSTRITETHKYVVVYSLVSPGDVHQNRQVRAFHPTRGWLVDIIKESSREFAYHKYTHGRGF